MQNIVRATTKPNTKPQTRNPYFCRKFKTFVMAAKTDVFQSPDYFLMDELLTDEQKLVRESVRAYVKKEISPVIEDYAQRAEFPQQIVKQLGDLGCFGPTIPTKYGGGGLDFLSVKKVKMRHENCTWAGKQYPIYETHPPRP